MAFNPDPPYCSEQFQHSVNAFSNRRLSLFSAVPQTNLLAECINASPDVREPRVKTIAPANPPAPTPSGLSGGEPCRSWHIRSVRSPRYDLWESWPPLSSRQILRNINLNLTVIPEEFLKLSGAVILYDVHHHRGRAAHVCRSTNVAVEGITFTGALDKSWTGLVAGLRYCKDRFSKGYDSWHVQSEESW